MSSTTDPWSTPVASLDSPRTTAELEPLEVTFDLLEANLPSHALGSFLKRPFVWVMVLVAIGALVGGARYGMGTWNVIIPAAVAFVFYRMWQGARDQVKNLRDTQRTVTMRLTEPHFVISDAESTVMLGWKTFSHFEEVKSAFYVHLGGQFRVLPKTVLSERELDLARRWLSRHLPSKPPGRQGSFKTLALWLLLVLTFWAIYQVIQRGQTAQ